MRDRLSVSVTLTAGGTEHTIPGGNVRAVSLRLTPWGAEGTVELVIQDDKTRGGEYEDKLFADFQKPDLAEIALSVKAVRSDAEKSPTIPSIETRGLVVERLVTEKMFDRGFAERPVLYRRYRVRFLDAARALWGQHHPTSLHAQQSFQDVLDANKGDKITLSYDWDTLSKAVPMVFFHLDPERGASFYDLLIWYVERAGGVFTFDHDKGTYKLAKTKDTSGTAAALPRDDVGDVTWAIGEPARYAPRVRNVAADSPKLSPITNADAATGIFRDTALCTDVAQDVDDRNALETSRARAPQTQLLLSFERSPTVPVSPGSLVTVSSSGGFSSSLRAAAGPLRVVELSLAATALDQGPDRDYGDAATGFDLALSVRLEDKADPFVHLPPFAAPHFPGYLEGKALSEVGEDTDVTYQVYQNADTSIDEYKVEIPAFENKQIQAPYLSTQATGTFYVPVYKHAKVRVACFFDRAEIVRVLDHRPGAKVAQDGQGQHLLFGKSDKSQTSVLHDYQDDKPVLRVLRTNDKDTVLLKLEEGMLTLKVEETKGGS
ncbi:hypothetical protein WME95_31570 [Sorangium sp. So ce327]|uniref:hypothetical protein n=1 Tax=Sorangium sp. So ce327 TaxID=3133301 RepID=UPI003F63FD1D